MYHIPVMTKEVIAYLNCRPGKVYVDCTLGGAGHTRAILKHILPDGILVAMDQDKDAIDHAKDTLKQYLNKNLFLFHGNFIYLREALAELNLSSADGILADLGLSLHQLESSGRGFSFRKDDLLDMRMDIRTETTAYDLVNESDEKHLAKIFREYGEELWAKRIARVIVRTRARDKIRSGRQLADIVRKAVPRSDPKSKSKNPGTRIFMALRIAVNKELERLENFMEEIGAYNCAILNPGGRVCVISFHSLEDRIVKHRLKEMEKGCICPPGFPACVCNKKSALQVLTKKARLPSKEEVEQNVMARSAKLRAARKK